MEIQQSSLYPKYMQNLGWTVVKLPSGNIFIRKFPFVGALAKFQRIRVLPPVKSFVVFLQKYSIRRLAIEPDSTIDSDKFHAWCQEISKSVRLNRSYFLPTKTIQIDLRPQEDTIFQRFTEAKRRAVRRASHLGVTVQESDKIQDLIHIKNKSAGFLGFITTTGVRQIWEAFAPNHASILLAYSGNPKKHIVGGVLVVLWDDIAYYWIAGSTQEGKRLFAPTLLAWESMRLAKKMGAIAFDFVGAWDERLPKENHEWKGFTKFKEGFGGSTLYYPILQTLSKPPVAY